LQNQLEGGKAHASKGLTNKKASNLSNFDVEGFNEEWAKDLEEFRKKWGLQITRH